MDAFDYNRHGEIYQTKKNTYVYTTKKGKLAFKRKKKKECPELIIKTNCFVCMAIKLLFSVREYNTNYRTDKNKWC